MAIAAASPISPMVRHWISPYTVGNSWAVATISMRMIMPTVCTGPNMCTKNGAISMPEPTPANPRISPAQAAMTNAMMSSGDMDGQLRGSADKRFDVR